MNNIGRNMSIRIWIYCTIIVCAMTIFIVFSTQVYGNCRQFSRSTTTSDSQNSAATPYSERGPHKLAVIVPFRDRFEELLEFAPYMHTFLNNQKVRHHIFVVNQIDTFRFNRASLINIGYIHSKQEHDYIAMHDVDLLPLNPKLSYMYPEEGPYSVSAPGLHPLYNYRTFIGGILLITNDHFRKLGGMPNTYWGWGGEDDEFYRRIVKANLTIQVPKDIKTRRTNTFRNLHATFKRKRDKPYQENQKQLSSNVSYTEVDVLKYRLVSRKEMSIGDAPVTILNVKLECNPKYTPWCMPRKPTRK